MKKILALTALSLLALSCKKEKVNTTQPAVETNYSYAATPGSYWIYDRYQVDSLGNETLQPEKDTVRLIEDTVIGNYTYHKFVGTKWLSGDFVSMERDSSGYIINEYGNILFSFNNVSMLLHSYDNGPFRTAIHIGANETVSTNFGEKNASVHYTEISHIDGTPLTNCGDVSARYNDYYVSGIGVVQNEIEYWSLMEACSKKRSKLSSYYIAP